MQFLWICVIDNSKLFFLFVFILISGDNHFFFELGAGNCYLLQRIWLADQLTLYDNQHFSTWKISRLLSSGQFSLDHTFIEKCNLRIVWLTCHFLMEVLNRSSYEKNFSLFVIIQVRSISQSFYTSLWGYKLEPSVVVDKTEMLRTSIFKWIRRWMGKPVKFCLLLDTLLWLGLAQLTDAFLQHCLSGVFEELRRNLEDKIKKKRCTLNLQFMQWVPFPKICVTDVLRSYHRKWWTHETGWAAGGCEALSRDRLEVCFSTDASGTFLITISSNLVNIAEGQGLKQDLGRQNRFPLPFLCDFCRLIS